MAHTYSVCKKCESVNKVDSDRALAKAPMCGKCGENLPMHGLVTEVNGAGLQKLIAKSDQPVVADFWASWCGPCRLNNPVLRQLYADFHSKGLEIVNVSLDEKRDRWVEAVKQDKLVWTQVSSLKGWKDPVTQLYSITAIPAIFVLDADNNIIASGLHGEELKNFVSGLFAEKGAK